MSYVPVVKAVVSYGPGTRTGLVRSGLLRARPVRAVGDVRGARAVGGGGVRAGVVLVALVDARPVGGRAVRGGGEPGGVVGARVGGLLLPRRLRLVLGRLCRGRVRVVRDGLLRARVPGGSVVLAGVAVVVTVTAVSAVGGVVTGSRVISGVGTAVGGTEERVGVEAAGGSGVVPDGPGVGVLVVHQLLSRLGSRTVLGFRTGSPRGKQWPRLYPAVCGDDNLRQVLRPQETGNRPSFGGRQTEAWPYVREPFYF